MRDTGCWLRLRMAKFQKGAAVARSARWRRLLRTRLSAFRRLTPYVVSCRFLLLLAVGFAFQLLQEPFTTFAQFLFQLACTIAIAARPRFGSVQVPAILSAMRVFDAEQP